ncbi:MAG TPA: hypothetical protein VIN08_10660 [Ohtaekwangia sp.]|uniref:hypothetical protein n=1 Tax=Ohtaekwangia sp. TaxID=2066019 RepID=UPI002F931D15
MTKVGLINTLLLFLLVSAAYGQKVKYKDIFGLLKTKQYEAAEPFLKKYIKENDDNPNAYLFMGIIFHEKSTKDDILKQTERTLSHMDTAVYYYTKAYQMITEKELKRNDEYYELYNRRDLRTGEFGVKLSDVQFDLQKKLEGLRERTDRLKMVKYYFVMADSLYKKSNALFRTIQSAYPGEKEFYLRADENVIAKLNALAVRYDSAVKAFENYKGSLTSLGKTSYNQVMVPREVTDFKKDGTSPADFYNNELDVWDYKRFAEKSKAIVEKEIFPMNKHLVEYDIEINKLREKLSKDSVSVKNDLTSLIDKLLMEQLKKYDKDPLPMEVFSLKIADLEYRSTLLEHKKQADSTDVHLQVERTAKELRYLVKLDSIAGKLGNENIDTKSEDYTYFITNTYNNTIVLKSYIKLSKEYAEQERRKLDGKLTKRNESLRWLVQLPDSIPLFKEAKRSRFKPLSIVEEKYTAGLYYKDSLNAEGYFYSITPTRVPDIKIKFAVDKTSFKQSGLPAARSLTFSDAAGQIYFVLMYSEKANKENKYAATLAKIYRSDGLAWSSNYQLTFVPKELTFKSDTGELTIKADALQSIIDKNGKLVVNK